MKVISFYSYKGGAGRTVCVSNVIPILAERLGASKDKPILVIDMDLDSNGLTYLFNKVYEYRNSSWSISSILDIEKDDVTSIPAQRMKLFGNDVLEEDEERGFHQQVIDKLIEAGDFTNHVINLLKQYRFKRTATRDEIERIFAENRYEIIETKKIRDALIRGLRYAKDDEHISRIINENIKALGMTDISEIMGFDAGTIKFIGASSGDKSLQVCGPMIARMVKLINECNKPPYNFCAVVLDSSSGRQGSAELIHRISDIIVYCTRVTSQFIKGTIDNLDFFNMQFDEWRRTAEIKSTPNIILLPVAIPKAQNIDPLKEAKNIKLLKEAKQELFKIPQRVSDQEKMNSYFIDNSEDKLPLSRAVPEVEAFKWKEEILYLKKSGSLTEEDEKQALEAYTCLVEMIYKYN